MTKRVLIISPHPDDETLSLGGSIAKMVNLGFEIFVLTVAGHLPPLYTREDYDLTIKEALLAYEYSWGTSFKIFRNTFHYDRG